MVSYTSLSVCVSVWGVYVYVIVFSLSVNYLN